MTLLAPKLPSLRRVQGIALRFWYLYLGSWPRLAEMIYWPLLNMLMLGFVSLAIIKSSGHATPLSSMFLGGVMLAEILTRTVLAVMIMYMEEIWSRNLGHLFASPLRLRDYLGSLMALSLVRCTVAIVPAFFVIYLLFDYSILTLGWALGPYALLLSLNGWWYGMFILAMLMRLGLAAEWLGWMCTWLLMPFMAPYYPVAILPTAFQAVSWALPGTYVFESMKYQVETGAVRWDYLGISLVLNLIYLFLATIAFKRGFNSARRSGGLLQMGE